jgi:hypothetical protein
VRGPAGGRVMARKSFGKRARPYLADMSLPPEQRGRRGRGRRQRKSLGGTPAAQLGRATGGKARKKRREGEARMRRDRGGGT